MTIKLEAILIFIANYINKIEGDIGDDYNLNKISDLNSADEYSIDWIGKNSKNKQKLAEKSKSKIIICDITLKYSENIKAEGKILIKVENPRLVIAKIGNEFFLEKKVGIHHTAVLHKEVELGENIFIGANCSIGKCKIGDNCHIDANVTIYDNVEIENNVRIYSGTVIGHDGMGCEVDLDGSLVPFPHLGSVLIKDSVTIGANCSIAKGSLSKTIIGRNCKINAFVNISHNDVIGENVWISSHVNIAGSVNIGNNCVIYSSSVFREGLTVGNDVLVGMGAVVTKNIPDNEVWYGSPAKKVR